MNLQISSENYVTIFLVVRRFPKQTMIPKNEIGALEFLEKFPMYDGRETLIAIWDTGVDPTARGLQVTSDGKPKIIDFIDASGSGDVRMLTTFRITPTERQITTLTGRTVTIPDHWNTKDGIIRVGVKPACELFPSQLMDRVSEETKARCWDPHMKRTSVRVKEALTNHQQGLTVHCATGEKAVSRATDNSLFSALLYYTVKILDEGRLLQIVTNSGSHGTHVAAIAAAYYPQAGSPPTDTTVVNCNGIAPGAQLVSIKIADTHLAAMETNVALLRAVRRPAWLFYS
ncbi:unnamed protein product [Schistocephalus solidus]|uniref:Peptidase_S8 domain-containing protein n=1 Tax=Schistocephalus solidus TaxID=70667 RepID=A0A183T4W0_SCHSO|nr:unnamed protein product [Schistocephalus solidus]